MVEIIFCFLRYRLQVVYLAQCGVWDQSQISNRSDVLSFTSQPFDQVRSITLYYRQDMYLCGPVYAQLYVSSNATDTGTLSVKRYWPDFTAKWLDVYPNGTRMLLQVAAGPVVHRMALCECDGSLQTQWQNV